MAIIFQELNAGDTFRKDGVLYVKLPSGVLYVGSIKNAFQIGGNSLDYIPPATQVTSVQIAVVEEIKREEPVTGETIIDEKTIPPAPEETGSEATDS